MKKVLLSLLALSAVVLVACGPSKTYTAVETATNTAIEQVASVSDLAALGQIQSTWSEAVVDAQTLEGDEATKFNELATKFADAVKVKADSLSAVAAAVAQAQADSLAAAAAAAEAATPAKKK